MLILNTFVMTVLCLFCQAKAYDLDWVKDLKSVGFQGVTHTVFVSPLPRDIHRIFRVEAFPQTITSVPGWPFLDKAMLNELKTLRQKGVVIAFTRSENVDDRAWSLVRSGEFGGCEEDLWPAIVLTPKADRLTVIHEIQHLEDFMSHLNHEISQDLEVAGFLGGLGRLLFNVVWEARAFNREYESLETPAQKEQLIVFFTQRYMTKAMHNLRIQSERSKKVFAKIFSKHTRDFAKSEFLTVIAMPIAQECEGFFTPLSRPGHSQD